MSEKMTVSVEHDFCCGGGPCREMVPEIFGEGEDGLTRTMQNGIPMPDNESGRIEVPENLRESVLLASEFCPGKCIEIKYIS